MTRRVHVQYYAVLRERAGAAAETVETAASDAAALYDELSERHGLAFPRAMLRPISLTLRRLLVLPCRLSCN